MKQLKQVRDGSAKYDLAVPNQLPEFYVDGLSSAYAGGLISKLVFYSVSAAPTETQINEAIEARQATVQLAIPTAALIEIAMTILKITTQNKASLEEGLQDYKNNLESAFSSIKQLSEKISEDTVQG